MTVQEAKPIAQALADAAGCDHRTKDVSGVWRIPGGLNWPNKKKVERGRTLDPQPVRIAKPWTDDLIDPEALQTAVAPHSRPKSETSEHSRAADGGAQSSNCSLGAGRACAS